MSVSLAPLEGTLRFIRYGFMPNRLQYCGPTGENRTLFDYGVERVSDGGLPPLLGNATRVAVIHPSHLLTPSGARFALFARCRPGVEPARCRLGAAAAPEQRAAPGDR